MKIALIGYGKMGRTIEKIAQSRGHEIVAVIDVNNTSDFDSENFKSADAAIEFTIPDTAVGNYKKCFNVGIPVVSGTTGWLEHMDEIKEICEKQNQTFFYASNFSLGVNIFFQLNKYLAKIMGNFSDYNVGMEEVHHIHKLDSPSGTAISLAEDIIRENKNKKSWSLENQNEDTDIAIHCIREGEVPGIHEVKYESSVDVISIKHDAKSRDGFALGAVLAAEFVADKKGFLGMQDMLKF